MTPRDRWPNGYSTQPALARQRRATPHLGLHLARSLQTILTDANVDFAGMIDWIPADLLAMLAGFEDSSDMTPQFVKGIQVLRTNFVIDRHPMAGTVEETPTGQLVITFVTGEPSITYEAGEWQRYLPPGGSF